MNANIYFIFSHVILQLSTDEVIEPLKKLLNKHFSAYVSVHANQTEAGSAVSSITANAEVFQTILNNILGKISDL